MKICTEHSILCTLILALSITTISAIDLIENIVDRTTTSRPNIRPTRTKRMYKMCPPKFQRIGNECYYISTYKANWLDAHFECKDRNSKLAEPLRLEDRRIRKYLLQYDRDHTDKWIGANYNWERQKWQWGYSGRDLTYQAFSQMSPKAKSQLKYHCAVFSADLRYRWSPRQCTNLHYFVCEHRMPIVSEKNRNKIYTKWNETYPNELANEIEVIISTPPRNKYKENNGNRDSNRIHPVEVTSKERNRTDLNPANYGDTRPADRRSRQQSRGFHAVANLNDMPKISRGRTRVPTVPQRFPIVSMANNVPPSSFRVDINQPNQSGQRFGTIQQKIAYDENGKPSLKQNVGQMRFALDVPLMTTIVPEATTKARKDNWTKPLTETSVISTTIKPTASAILTTTPTTLRQTSETELKKKQYRDSIRERLSKLTPEEQREFFEKRRLKKIKDNAENNV